MPDILAVRTTGNTDVRPVSEPWPIKDVIYVAIIGSLMIAALLEWILWLLSFLYCLAKVFWKADGKGRWVVRMLAVLNMLFFIAMRVIFLPVMVVTLPLPAQIEQFFPHKVVVVLQMFAFYSFAGLLVVPWLFCVFSQVTHNVGRTRRVKTVLDDHSAPKMVVIMPCYNEEPDVLLRTISSIVECDYPRACMHVFLSFDGDAENELYLNTIEKLGVPLTLEHYPRSIDVTYHESRITVSRFPHGGKRSCQKRTFKLIDKIYAEYLRRNDNLFLLFIDSDCILDKVCIQNFMYEMELKPGSKRNVLAMTGVITSTTVKHSWLTLLQDMEYIHGQLFERSVESACGAVTCLPGALTCLRFSAFRRVARYYFADKVEQCNDMFDYGKCHLGEDRWLTHLFMIGAKERYQIQMNTGAFCKTEAVQTFKSLLKQRRRWFLGFITNEACMVTDIRMYKLYPLLCVMRLASNTIRTTALLFFIIVISLMSTEEKIQNLPIGFIGVSLGLNWLLMLYFGAKLGRYKIMMYPFMFVINPFMNWLYMVYGIFTAGQRTWGGPRADAGRADAHTTPAEVVEQAARDGDDFNVAPETFRPAIEAATHRLPHQAPLLPSGHLEGRFAAAEELPGGWFQQANDSGTLHADMTPREREGVLYGKTYRRDSLESSQSDLSLGSLYRPRRVESIFGENQAVDEPNSQLTPRSRSREMHISDIDRLVISNSSRPLASRYSSDTSLRSARSNSSVSIHFGLSQAPFTQTPKTPIPRRHSTPRVADRTPIRRNSFDGALTIPASTYQQYGRALRPLDRGSKSKERSPLARKSFTRLASPPRDDDDDDDDVDDDYVDAPMSAVQVIELERLSAARASLEAERRGRQPGPGRHRRPRKLSKQRPGSSRSSSRV